MMLIMDKVHVDSISDRKKEPKTLGGRSTPQLEAEVILVAAASVELGQPGLAG